MTDQHVTTNVLPAQEIPCSTMLAVRNPKRTVVFLSLFCALLLGVSYVIRAQAPAAPPFKAQQVGPKVWAVITDVSNAGFVIGDDGVLVIDTFADADTAKRLLAQIRELTKLPIRYVVNTHYHLDHVAGNGVFVEAGTVVLAQRNVRSWIHTENLRLFGSDIKPEQKALIEGFVPPMMVYEEGVDLYLGSRAIQVRSFPGHTGWDSVVLIPDTKTVFAGDLFWDNMLPNLIDASTKPWIETLDELTKITPGYAFVPGHGDVGNAQDVQAFRGYLVTLGTLVADAQAQGKTGDALAESVMPALTEKYGRWDGFEYFIKPNILDMDAELRGKKRIPQAEMGK